MEIGWGCWMVYIDNAVEYRRDYRGRAGQQRLSLANGCINALHPGEEDLVPAHSIASLSSAALPSVIAAIRLRIHCSYIHCQPGRFLNPPFHHRLTLRQVDFAAHILIYVPNLTPSFLLLQHAPVKTSGINAQYSSKVVTRHAELSKGALPLAEPGPSTRHKCFMNR